MITLEELIQQLSKVAKVVYKADVDELGEIDDDIIILTSEDQLLTYADNVPILKQILVIAHFYHKNKWVDILNIPPNFRITNSKYDPQLQMYYTMMQMGPIKCSINDFR